METNSATSSDGDYEEPPTPKRQRTSKSCEKQKHRKQKFREEWRSLPDFKYWLQPVTGNPEKANCVVCKTDFVAELGVIKNHMKTKKHTTHARSVSQASTSVLRNFVANPNAPTNADTQVKKAELQICSFFAAHNLSFRNVDHLEKMLKSAFPDSGIAQKLSLKRTKCTAMVSNVIGDFEKEELIAMLKGVKFSIIIDESTDISTTKVACVVVRAFHRELGKVFSRFYELIPLLDDNDSSTCTAEKLFKKVTEAFTSVNISLDNIVGFGADGCNTMLGEHNSVASRFKELCPGIIISKCICHSLHICASNACKALPRSCEDLARNIYTFFKASSKRIHEFKQFQIFAETEIHKMLHPSQTRWLSLTAVVYRVLEQWPALLLFFNDKWLSERLIASQQIYEALNDPFVKLYYYFLQWVLPKFTSMNEFFQSDKVLIAQVHSKMESQFRDLLLCYMRADYVMSRNLWQIDPCNETNFIHSKSVYLGVKVLNEISTNKLIINRQDLLDHFYSKCVEFLEIGCSEILKRYDFKDSVFEKLQFLCPKNAMSVKYHENLPSLQPLMPFFKRFCSEDKWQGIDDEWRALPYAKNVNICDEIDMFWAHLSQAGNEFCAFQNLTNFVFNILSIPHSSAECERVFSQVNLIKTKTRNKLITSTLNGTLLASQHVKRNGCCKEFKPPRQMLHKVTTKMYNFKNNVDLSNESCSSDE